MWFTSYFVKVGSFSASSAATVVNLSCSRVTAMTLLSTFLHFSKRLQLLCFKPSASARTSAEPRSSHSWVRKPFNSRCELKRVSCVCVYVCTCVRVCVCGRDVTFVYFYLSHALC